MKSTDFKNFIILQGKKPAKGTGNALFYQKVEFTSC